MSVGQPQACPENAGEPSADGKIKVNPDLVLCWGRGSDDRSCVTDLAAMPYLLVSGGSESQRAAYLHAMILPMLERYTPEALRLVIFCLRETPLAYSGIAHLLCPAVSDQAGAETALQWLIREMERRCALISSAEVSGLTSYNRQAQEPLPRIICVITELFELITSGKEIRPEVSQLLEKASTVGIHFIIATGHPADDAFVSLGQVASPAHLFIPDATESSGEAADGEPSGCEALLSFPVRVPNCFVQDDAVTRIVEELQKYGEPEYIDMVAQPDDTGEPVITDMADQPDDTGEPENTDEVTQPDDSGDSEGGADAEVPTGASDPLYSKAVEIVLSKRRASILSVQRHLGVPYGRAADLLSAMEDAGVVSKVNSSGRREILVPTPDR